MQTFGAIQKSNIINIVGRALAHIDPRLIDHGERVAYIADSIVSMPGCPPLDGETLPILCLLHDIGAYKTEEIDDMACFETMDVMQHAAYGYAFLKNATALKDDAEAILYHHTPYKQLITIDTPQRTTAALIYLADRIDILLMDKKPVDWDRLARLAGSEFSPELMALFFAAEERYHISKHVLDGSYKDYVLPRLQNLQLSDEEIVDYLRMLVYSIDFRSPFTVTHTANATAVSVALAERMGLDGQQQAVVRQGAFLHDIGKIGIPYAILENPGKLGDAQMEIMKTHVALSEEILRGVVPDEICDIAVRHHEKLNGKGYHKGLKGEALTPPQRIVAVADIVSALNDRRSYKEAFPKEKTLSILTAMRDNGELCPQTVNTLIENYDSILEEVGRHGNPVIELYERIRSEYQALIAAAEPA